MEEHRQSVPEISQKKILQKIREIGVDFVSSGALTHSAPILDISMKNLHAKIKKKKNHSRKKERGRMKGNEKTK